jgi:hypothetical protein
MPRQNREEDARGNGADSEPGSRAALENFELNFHILSTARQLSEACDELDQWAVKYANAHRDFKRERAKIFLTAAATYKTVAERDAAADSDPKVDELRFDNYLTEGMMQASLERVRSLRGTLSAFQTLANKQKEEAAFDRTGPQYSP